MVFFVADSSTGVHAGRDGRGAACRLAADGQNRDVARGAGGRGMPTGGVVAVGVIGLRRHYFTDTVADAAVGIGTVCGPPALLVDLSPPRRRLFQRHT